MSSALEEVIGSSLSSQVGLLTNAAFTLVMVLAALLDFHSRRIPNYLTITAVVVGILLRAPYGLQSVGLGVLGIGLALVLTIPLFFLGVLGGGDVKLLGVVGAFMGPGQLIGACLLIALLGGVFALADAALKGTLGAVFRNLLHVIISWFSRGETTVVTLTSPSAMTIPYGVPIAVGALAWWYGGGNLA